MRAANRSAVLKQAWGMPQTFTASELMALSGLTRATVLDVCRDLLQRGWIQPGATETAATRGRQALRFAFNARRTLVVGADIGHHSLSVEVADLSGTTLGSDTRVFDEDDDEQRGSHLTAVTLRALEAAGVDRSEVSTACVGIAAPVTTSGTPPTGSSFWGSVAIDLERLAVDFPGWGFHVENDANLAVLAEMHHEDIAPDATLIALLSGERLGAGIMIGGRLHRGAHGTAGEMEYLDQVVGVEGSFGLAALARILAGEALRTGADSSLRRHVAEGTGEVSAAQVLQAAADGDRLALTVLDRTAERLATTLMTIGGLLDPELVVISGGVAGLAQPVVADVNRRLAELLPAPPEVRASSLGREVVLKGAVRMAIDRVRATALADLA
ncbi:ROK family protein [Mycetocola reblochoni]|uniref:N-acetylglucosamine kinase bacterial type predicted / Transcriptional regulator n=3 Tax=Mycetocola reblochoni TaxID=331618 RepID=A0A1R4IZV1_9MICO|nr:ROK family protein [Mycetocola reblochoni]SJN25055.1 N-acetylglucosamine kinase bacterial type predicted / Transcriptional regulator [Mycetocola reblochoni REB411]